MKKGLHPIPRKIWLLWYQGLSEAPFVVSKCMDSWARENQNWEVIILDKNNLGEYIALDLPEEKLANISLTKQSNLVRLQLLSNYGGVWADATTFCTKPLDEWIHDSTASGFFAFYKPGTDRLMSNWFMASEKACPLVLKLRECYVSFFMSNDFKIDGRFRKKIIKWLSKLLNRSEKTTRYWFSPVVTKLLRVYPYYVFHYMFERLVSNDSECQNIWNNTKKISADGAHGIQRSGPHSILDEDMKREIDKRQVPVYKLTYGYDHVRYLPSTLLYYLL